MDNKDEEFQIPPVSTLIGSTLPNFFRVLALGKPDLRFIPKLLLTLIVILISTPFQIYEYLYFRNKVKKFHFRKSPIFIIGHWRSGTTHLHNLLCKDPNHGFLTTYQSVFPNNLKSKWIFKSFMKWKIPETRPADNVKLSPDFPQEEEFALANMTVSSFYHFFYFPSKNNLLYERFIQFKSTDELTVNKFEQKYKELLIKASINSKKERVIIKNPVNTGKVKMLLKMYPDAKFIHIYRNPVITFLSTYKFFTALIPTTALEKYDNQFIKEMIIQNYKKLMLDFLQAKSHIPPKNLYEIKFEEFDEDNLGHLKEIYEQFDLNSWDDAVSHFKAYASKQKHYKKNKHKIKTDDLNRILKEWDFAMQAFGYDIPENLEILDVERSVTQP